ncbi:MAG: polymer-forming cytoskeletal protein [Pseudomonadota bacterium]
MSDTTGLAIIAADTEFEGRITGARRVEIAGRVTGEIAARHVTILPGGHFTGRVMSASADVAGTLEGEVFVKQLIRIASTGVVHGDVQYGAIEMAPGGDLAASLRNVPPTLAGDGEMSVHRGRSAIVTRDDLRAIDPDDAPEDLTFSVQRTHGGHIGFRNAAAVSITSFTQADLNAGRILFQHDGSGDADASFAVTVADDDGATAGTAQTVKVSVVALPDRRPPLEARL